jgi:hypothetical protein
MIHEQAPLYAAKLGHKGFQDRMDGSIGGRNDIMFEWLPYLVKLPM